MAYTDVAEPDHHPCKPVAKRACLNCKNDFNFFWHLTSQNTLPELGQKPSPPQPSS